MPLVYAINENRMHLHWIVEHLPLEIGRGSNIITIFVLEEIHYGAIHASPICMVHVGLAELALGW